MKKYLILILLASCGDYPIRVIGCPKLPEEAYYPLLEASQGTPVNVLCVDSIDYPAPDGAAAVLDWPGNGPLYPARVRLLNSLDRKAMIYALAHEAMHLKLWHANNEPCASHKTECGWVEPKITIE